MVHRIYIWLVYDGLCIYNSVDFYHFHAGKHASPMDPMERLL